MLIQELMSSPTFEYHLTDVLATLDILKNKRFKLSRDGGDTYFMSFARSVKSGYFTMMIGPDAVMLVVNAATLKKSFNVQPHKNETGSKELKSLGVNSNEYEDRIIGNGQWVNIPHVSSLFKEIRVLRTAERSKGTNFYTDEQFAELQELCNDNGVELKIVSTKGELRKAGGK